MIRLGILGSTRGTHLSAIADAILSHQLDAQIELVISNNASALILEKAQHYKLPAHFLDIKNLTREAYDEELSCLLQKYQVDLVVLIGYMRILSNLFVSHWKNRIINVHPSLLPDFSGLMDMDVHRAVLDAGLSVSGCTAHFVTEKVDAGPIILQKKCMVTEQDTPLSLKSRVQEMEGCLLVEAIRKIAKEVQPKLCAGKF